jgi:hypothetical protein
MNIIFLIPIAHEHTLTPALCDTTSSDDDDDAQQVVYFMVVYRVRMPKKQHRQHINREAPLREVAIEKKKICAHLLAKT